MNLMDLFVSIEIQDNASDEVKGVRGEVQKTGEAAENATGKTNKFGNAIGKGLQTAAKIAVTAVSAVATAIAGLGKIAFDYNTQMETYTTNFGVMLGNTEKAVAKVESLKELAAKTPFEMTDLANATQTLLAFNVANEDTNSILTRLGDISLGNAQKLESLTRAYGKMNAAQKVQLEDINMMIDAGFNPLLIVSEEMGLTMQETYDKISKGEIAFDAITRAIEKATSAGGQFYKGMEQASKTTSGLISTLQDNVNALLGDVFEPVSSSLKDTLLPRAIGYVEMFAKVFEEQGVEGLVGALGGVLATLVSEVVNYAPMLVDGAISIINALVDGLIDNASSIGEGAVSLVFTFVDGVLSALPQIAELAMALIVALAQGLASANLEALPPAIVDTVLQIVAILTAPEQVALITEAALQIIVALVQGIVAAFPMMKDAMTQVIISAVTVLAMELPNVVVAGIDIISSLIRGIVEALPRLVASMPKVIIGVIFGIVDNLDKIILAAPQIVLAIIGGMISAIPALINAVPELIKAIIDAFASYEWGNIGTNIVQGIKDGFLTAWNNFIGVLSDVWDATLGKLGLDNPFPKKSTAQAPKASSSAIAQASGASTRWDATRNNKTDLLLNGQFPSVGGLTSSYNAPAVTGTTFSGTTINVTVGDPSTDGKEIGEAVAFALQEMTNRRIAVYG